MATIVAKISEMTEAQQVFMANVGTIKQQTAVIANCVNNIASSYDSTSGAYLIDKYTKVNTILERMCGTIAKGASDMQTIISKYQEQEMANKSKIDTAINEFAEPTYSGV